MQEEELREEPDFPTNSAFRPYIETFGISVYGLSLFSGNAEGLGVIIMLFTLALKDNRIFNRAFRNGRFCSCFFVTAYYLPNGEPFNRMGISVSKKTGCNAVERNRAKRIIRAAYRLNEQSFPIGYDIVFAVRAGIKDRKTQDIEKFINTRLLEDMKKAVDENGVFIGKMGRQPQKVI